MTVTVSTSPYVLAAGATLSVADEDAIRLQSNGDAPPIAIAGAVSVTASSALTSRELLGILDGIKVGDSSFYRTSITIEASGSIVVDATAARFHDAYGIQSGSWTPQISNAGLVSVSARAGALGIQSNGVAFSDGTPAVINSGTVRVNSTAGDATGVYMSGGDSFSNAGLVEVTAAGSAYGVRMFQWDSTFLNTGAIRAMDNDPGHDSIAVYLNTTVLGFLNTGTLEGDYALKYVDYNVGGEDSIFATQVRTFQNTGQMLGTVDLGKFQQVLLNSGLIRGDVNLGSGADTYSGRDGAIAGLVSGGDGADSLGGGAGFDYLQGNAGADTVSGGGGNDWVLGGRDNDNLNADAGDDFVYGNLGNDWCDGGDGADLVRGGQGDDVILGQAGNDWLSGDRGDDTVTGGAGADIFHGSQDAGLDRVTDFSAAQGDRVQLDPGAVYTLRQEGADTIIDLGGANRMVLVGVQLSSLPMGWIFGA